MVVKAKVQNRPLYEVAREIRKDWQKVYFGAESYLKAMATMNKATEPYICDSGESIVIYFLGNANSWRGETAKRIKQELKDMVGIK